MAVDLRINSIQATITSLDEKVLHNAEFLARLAAAVRIELDREGEVDRQRQDDQAPRVKRRL